MKREWKSMLVAVVMLTGFGVGAAQTSTPSTMSKDDLFAGTEKFANGASDVTELNMDPQSLNLVNGKDAHRAHRMVLNVVRTYSYEKPGMYNIADVEAIRNRLNTGEWHCSVHTRDMKHGESTDICNRNRTDGMVETAIITVEPKELTFIHTIKQGSGEGGGGMSEVWGPMGSTGAAWRAEFAAEMAEQQAEMKVQMAETKPGLALQMAEMKPVFAQMRLQMAEQMKNFRTPAVHVDAPAMHFDVPAIHVDVPPMPEAPPAPPTQFTPQQ